MMKEILHELLYRPIFLWDLWEALKSKAKNRFSKLIGLAILPAQLLKNNNACQSYNKQMPKIVAAINHFYAAQLSAELKEVKTLDHSDAALSTFEISTMNQDIMAENQRYIINFLGNYSCLEEPHIINDVLEDAIELNSNVITFNYRGVMQSKGEPKSKDDLVNDGITIVEELLKRGIQPNNIVLKGYSVGGAIATLVAKHFHDQEKELYLFNDRSFSTITRVVIGAMRNKNIVTKMLSKLAKPVIKYVLSSTNWEINAARSYHALPEPFKDHIYVKSGDKMISYYASLHRSIEKERQKQQMKINTIAKCHQVFKRYHRINQDSKNVERKLAALQKQITHLDLTESEMKVKESHTTDDAHQVKPKYLVNSLLDTGRDRFTDFFRRRTPFCDLTIFSRRFFRRRDTMPLINSRNTYPYH